MHMCIFVKSWDWLARWFFFQVTIIVMWLEFLPRIQSISREFLETFENFGEFFLVWLFFFFYCDTMVITLLVIHFCQLSTFPITGLWVIRYFNSQCSILWDCLGPLHFILNLIFCSLMFLFNMSRGTTNFTFVWGGKLLMMDNEVVSMVGP